MTQEKLAEEAELSLNFIGNLERGEKLPSLDTIVKVARAMEMTGAQLLTRAGL